MIKKKELNRDDYMTLKEAYAYSELITEGAIKSAVDRRAIRTVMKYDKFGSKPEPFIEKGELKRFITSQGQLKKQGENIMQRFFADAE